MGESAPHAIDENVNLLINVSSDIDLAIFVITRTRKLVGMPDQVYIQCRHNKHVLR